MRLRACARNWGWIAVGIGLVLMLPGLIQRVDADASNNAYEFVVPDSELVSLLHAGLEEEDVYEKLQSAGLRSVAVEMETPGDLEDEGRILVFDRAEVASQLLAEGSPASDLPGGTFIADLRDDRSVLDRIAAADPSSRVEAITIGQHELFLVSGVENLEDLPIGYDLERIAALTSRGLSVVARIPEDLREPEFGRAELRALNERFGVDRIMLTGDATPFNGSPGVDAAFAHWLDDRGFALIVIEFANPVGADRYTSTINRAIRLHGLDLAHEPSAADAIDQGARALKERNIRMLFMRPPGSRGAEARFDALMDVMGGIGERAPEHLAVRAAEPFKPLRPGLMTVFGGIAVAAGIGAVMGSWISTLVAILLATLGGLVAVTAALSNIGPLMDVQRLGVAIAFAVAAVFAARPTERLAGASIQYLKSMTIVLAGGLALTGLALESRFLAGTADFWGVKALLVAPVAIAALWAAYRSLREPTFADIQRIVQWRVKVWQLAALAITGVAVWYLMLRSGNTGAAPEWELAVRQWLENVLFVRPRTKEALLGFPALLLGVVITASWRHGWWLYVLASVGTASAIDTFAHFHSPLTISLLRTAYGGAFGFLFGVLGVIALRLLSRWLGPRFELRAR